MTTTRPPIPVTNLKERIAALEQRNVGSGASRPTSPTPSAPPPPVTGVVATGFRDKIAKFEKKGGVPVPRGSFGLGAPPTSEGPRRRGELYGNRIPAPARAVSGGILPSTRASSPTDMLGSPTFGAGDRRSFSLSSVISDFEDPYDYTPIASPTFAFPLDSPESIMTSSHPPESMPSLTSIGDAAGVNKPHILRGTSFQKALEIARNAETAKLEARESLMPMPRQEEMETESVPAIVVSSEDATATAIHDSPTPEPPRPLPYVPEAPAVIEPETKVSEPQVVTTGGTVPPVREEVVVPIFAVTPLTIRKRRPTDATPPKVEEIVAEAALPLPSPAAPDPPIVVVHEPPTTQAPMTHEVLPEVHNSMPPVTAQAPSPTKRTYEVTSTLPSPTLPTVVQPEILAASNHPTPQIVLHEEEVDSGKTDLALDSEVLDDVSLMSPSPDTGNTSVGPLTDMLGSYFASKDATGEPIARPSTPPSRPAASPLSPMATLAYDAPESPEAPHKPTIEVPDPQSFLSPPPTGFRSSVPSSGGATLGSMSSMSSRPMSMIETSPSHISRAMRMTPATSRGVPMFLPPTSAQPRKSDFVYFPPTPEEVEFGSVTLHKSSQSFSMGAPRRGSEMVIDDPSARPHTTFTAVVHGKVRETPASATLPTSFKQQQRVPETPQIKRVQQTSVMEPPTSPAQSELAALLQEAVLLESSLDRGELPTEANVRLQAEEKERREKEAVAAAARARRAAEEDERRRIAAAAERLKAKPHEPTSGKLKHTFLVPLSKARSAHRKEALMQQLDSFPTQPQVDPLVRPKSAGLPEKSSVHASQSGQVQRPVTPENTGSSQYLETPPKQSRFAGFRRLGSTAARPNTIHGHSNRYSVSTSSEDSAPVMTPPEGSVEFGSLKQSTIGEFGHMHPTNTSTTSFPSLSPKKSSTGIGRAASFAERVFYRSRTKSNGSVLSSTSEMTVSTIDRIPEDAPSLPILSISGLPTTSLYPIPNTPAIVLPISETETRVLHPPKRSTSLARSSRLPPLPTEVVPPLPSITSSAFFSTTAEVGDVSGDSLMLPNTTADATRPHSWTSMSSAGSLPSPLFDKDLFDAFPSVPNMTPALSATASVHRVPARSTEPTISFERPSFDSDLLSSAIHLASSRKPTAPILAPASNTSLRRSATTASRRSQETGRL